MAALDRSGILILFVSFLIGSAAGWLSRMHWGNSLITVASTLIGTVAGYCIIVAVLRAAGHPVE
jgi:predicted membrane protein